MAKAERLEDLGKIYHHVEEVYDSPALDECEMNLDHFIAKYLHDELALEELYNHLTFIHRKVLKIYDLAQGDE